MGADNYIYMGYGCKIPKAPYERLLPREEESSKYFTGDYVYTHEIGGGIFFFGRIPYATEARRSLWDGNREVVDVEKALKNHPMFQKKIERVADDCGRKAKYFILTFKVEKGYEHG